MHPDDVCTTFLERGTYEGVPTTQCKRRWRIAITCWPGEPREVTSFHCTQHSKKAKRLYNENKVPFTDTDRGTPQKRRMAR